MQILFISAECAPFAKVGGLADVVGSLPKALQKLGHDVRIVLPKYKSIDIVKFRFNAKGALNSDIRSENNGYFLESVLPNTSIPVYLIGNDFYFERDGIYQLNGVDFPDNHERFALFCQLVFDLCKKINWRPDIFHCHDWQTALVPLYLKRYFLKDYFFLQTKTVFTIHNLAYQGVAPKEKLSALALPSELFTPQFIEFYGNINLLKAGLIFSDVLTTVSETYSKEIQTPEFGCGLEGVLKERASVLFGILNGIDYDEWNPNNDPEIPINYSIKTLYKKKKNKKELQKVVGLELIEEDFPLIGFINRLTDQKGIDILVEALPELLKEEIQIVILGTGEPKYHKLLSQIAEKYSEKVSVNLRFDNKLAHLIYAGADIFLIPSKFEPCGLTQMISFAYGTVPVARKTGGLADSVVEFNPLTKKGTGFLFSEYSIDALLEAVNRALSIYKQKDIWKKLQVNCMTQDFSWTASAKKYETIYQRVANI